METSQLPIPKTFDEFYQHWNGWIDGAIEKISKGRIRRGSEEAEDTKQQVYLRLLQQRHIEKYDAAKGSFSHHIYRVVLHVLANKWDKDTRTPTNNAIPVVESAPEDFVPTGMLVLETFTDMMDDSMARTIETRELLDRFELFLTEQSKPWGSPVQLPDGSMRQKSLALVFRLMRQSNEPKEIAIMLRVTSGSVFSYINKIKAFAEQFKGALAL